MWTFVAVVLGLTLLGGILSIFIEFVGPVAVVNKPKYRYNKKRYLLTQSENIFFKTLSTTVADKCNVFAQVHLGSLLDGQIKGQSWRGAFAHINRKSVDFVLCDKENNSPQLAIELDDFTHARQDRQDRDREVERILAEAGIPLLRISNRDISSDELWKSIVEKTSQVS